MHVIHLARKYPEASDCVNLRMGGHSCHKVLLPCGLHQVTQDLAASHRQWSWPLWLPVQFFGIFPDSVLVDNDSSAPWADELKQKLFSSAVGEQALPL